MNIELSEHGKTYELTDIFVNADDRIVLVSDGVAIVSISPSGAAELCDAIKKSIIDYRKSLNCLVL